MVRRILIPILVAGLSVFTLGCADSGGDRSGGADGGGSGGGSGGPTLSVKPIIQLEVRGKTYKESNPDILNFNNVEVGGQAQEKITITNVAVQGNDDLVIKRVELVYSTPPGASDDNGDAIQLTSMNKGTDNVALAGNNVQDNVNLVAGGDENLDVVVTFTRYADNVARNATLYIEVSDTQSGNTKLEVKFGTADAKPVANISPSVLDFGQVAAGETPGKPINVSNTGQDDLLVYQVLFTGHPDYRFFYESNEWTPDEPIEFDPPLVVSPQGIKNFVVKFMPEVPDPAEGQVIFYTNDPAHSTGILVKLTANTEGPAIQVTPKKVQFGGKLVGQKALLPIDIKSVGTAPLEVFNIQMKEGFYPNFQLDYSPLGLDATPTAEAPVLVDVNQQVTFNVTYTPNVENPIVDGAHVLDEGIILVESNAFDADLEIEVTGLGVDKECPTAVIVIQEGEQVIPQTNLHLFGDQSFAPSGAIASWKWSVEQPAGSASVFIPSDTFPNPTFETNTAGEYLYSLDVWDEAGVKSCIPYKQNVLVIPDEAIHVELLWHTPNDPDETDQGPEAGSDVDLHFLHDKFAASGPDLDEDGKPDGWFDQPFDCFWFNAHPNWGSFDPSIDDDPGLDRDDTDGAGPENLNLNIPENTTYRVGVHYWSDHEYGPSFIMVRIYIYSNLVFEVTDVKLVNHDMWDVATVDWPSGKVTLVQEEGQYKITPGYQNPFFFQP
jgi:hypothetical protein